MNRASHVASFIALHLAFTTCAVLLVGLLVETENPTRADQGSNMTAPIGSETVVVDQFSKDVRIGDETDAQVGDDLFEDAGAPTAQPPTELVTDSGDISTNRTMREGRESGPTAQIQRPKAPKQAMLGGSRWLAAVGLLYAFYRLTKTTEAD